MFVKVHPSAEASQSCLVLGEKTAQINDTLYTFDQVVAGGASQVGIGLIISSSKSFTYMLAVYK